MKRQRYIQRIKRQALGIWLGFLLGTLCSESFVQWEFYMHWNTLGVSQIALACISWVQIVVFASAIAPISVMRQSADANGANLQTIRTVIGIRLLMWWMGPPWTLSVHAWRSLGLAVSMYCTHRMLGLIQQIKK